MSKTAFEILHERIDEHLPKDLTKLDFYKWNALKLFQHATVYTNNQSSKKDINPYLITGSIVEIWLRSLFSIWKFRTKPKHCSFRTLVIPSDRYKVDENGRRVSMYFHKLLSATEEVGLLSNDTDYPNTCKLPETYRSLGRLTPLRSNWSVIIEARRMFGEVLRTNEQGEEFERYLAVVLHVFLIDYLYYFNLFKSLKPKAVYFICHYHKEGLIAALKELNILSIELQHGLIDSNDLYYCYDMKIRPIENRALFADQIIVYGDYWKHLLQGYAGYSEAKILVGGDYLFHSKLTASKRKTYKQFIRDNNRVLLVTTQKGFEDVYISYVQQLAAMIDDQPWDVWVKLHPSEKKVAAYRQLDVLPNVHILGNEHDIDHLFELSSIHISIYSTTFFDAQGFEVVNFSIQGMQRLEQYARNMVDIGVAYPIKFDENPIERWKSLVSNEEVGLGHREYYYAPYNSAIFQLPDKL